MMNPAREAKAQALKDFNTAKQPIYQVEKVTPFIRRNNFNGNRDIHISPGNDPQNREIVLERQEWAEAAFYYMRYIL